MVKNKVLFILHLPAPIHGAAMVGKFIKDSEVINSFFESDYINLSTSSELRSLGKGGAGKLLGIVKLQYNVLKALLSKQYDLFYMTISAVGPGFYKDLLVVALLKLFSKRIIYHFHNKGIKTRQHKKVDHLLYRFAFENTQGILLSPCLYPDIEKYFRKKDVFYCANGVPKIIGVPSDKDKNMGNSHSCRILFLSNMMVEKGVLVLLQGCKILKEKGLRFECHFVGEWFDISQAQFYSFLRENNLSDCVQAHGKKYNDDKKSFFARSDIFVLPTFKECFPLVVLEAMACGLPVVSTSEGGIPDIVVEGETGFLVQRKNVEALVEKVELLIRDGNLREQLGRAGKARFMELYSMETFEDNFVRILKNAASMYA